jgi:hypothetical protein
MILVKTLYDEKHWDDGWYDVNEAGVLRIYRNHYVDNRYTFTETLVTYAPSGWLNVRYIKEKAE